MTTVSMPSMSGPSATKRAPRSAWFGPSMPFARFGLIVNLALPLGILAWDAVRHRLGVNATQYAIHTTGLIAILYLLASLTVTPLRQITRLAWLVQFRRSLGVYAFYYAAAHLSIYFWWDQSHNLKSTAYEITHRYYLAIGFASLAIMAPLWATSFNAAIRWMGGRQWKWLHRTTYVAAVLAGMHFWLQSKSYKFYPNLWFAVFWALMLWRVVAGVVGRVRKPARGMHKSAAAPAAAGGKARSWKGELKVVGMFKETPAVRTFRLAPPDGKSLPFAFSAGQFLNLKVKVDDKDENRSYTIASPPTRDGYVELTVKREKDGHVSRYLHDMLMTGQSVAVTAPAGRFTFDPKDAKVEDGVLLVAGGVGVTPVMSILRDLTDRCWPGQIDLVFSVKTPDDVIFGKELDLLAARHPNLHVHKTFTQSAPEQWTGPSGRITAELLKTLVPAFVGRRAFVCGPDAMAKAVHEELRSAGVAEKRITTESFTPAAAAPPRSADAGEPAPAGEAATATFRMSGQTASIAAGQSVLEAAEAAGVRIDYQCRSGICGTCRCKLLEGTVHMDVRDALSDADEADGYILACQAYADGDVTVDA